MLSDQINHKSRNLVKIIDRLDSVNYNLDDLGKIDVAIQKFLIFLDKFDLSKLSDDEKLLVLSALIKSSFHLQKYNDSDKAWSKCLLYASKLNYQSDIVATVSNTIKNLQQGSLI